MKLIEKTALFFLVLIAGQAVAAESLSAGDETSVVYQYDSDKYHEIIIPAGSFAILELQEGERSSEIIQSSAGGLFGGLDINVIRAQGTPSIEKLYFSRSIPLPAATSIVIPTNKRIYHFRVINGDRNGEIDGEYILPTSKIRFDYP